MRQHTVVNSKSLISTVDKQQVPGWQVLNTLIRLAQPTEISKRSLSTCTGPV